MYAYPPITSVIITIICATVGLLVYVGVIKTIVNDRYRVLYSVRVYTTTLLLPTRLVSTRRDVDTADNGLLARRAYGYGVRLESLYVDFAEREEGSRKLRR